MTAPDDEFATLDERLEPVARDIEAPVEDVVEQAMPADPRIVPVLPRTSFEADDYDAIEQSRVVDLDDDY